MLVGITKKARAFEHGSLEKAGRSQVDMNPPMRESVQCQWVRLIGLEE
jgi:hypothetical protein